MFEPLIFDGCFETCVGLTEAWCGVDLKLALNLISVDLGLFRIVVGLAKGWPMVYHVYLGLVKGLFRFCSSLIEKLV